MSDRVWRQLQQSVPNAETPAQGSALRLALQLMLDDPTYPPALKSAQSVKDRLDEIWWNDTHRAGLEALALRWATTQHLPWLETLRKAVGHTSEEEAQTPLHSTDAGETHMATMLQDATPQDNGQRSMRSMVDVYGDPEARQELYRQKELMQAPPYNTPPKKLEDALRIAHDGRVTVDGDTITVKGSVGGGNKTYTIVNNRCNCGDATAGGTHEALKWSCQHAVAAELHQRTQQALKGLSAASLFALPPSTAYDPGTHMAVHEHACPRCGRSWDCSVLCGTLSLEKLCPTCDSMVSQDVAAAVPGSPEYEWPEAETPIEATESAQDTIAPEDVPEVAQEASSIVGPASGLEKAAAMATGVPELVEMDTPIMPHLPALPATVSSVTLLEANLDEWGKKRAVIARFLKSQLTQHVDYGPIHIGKNCEPYKQTKTCTNKYHWSKDNLFKPGSEKVAGLLQLRPTFERDEATWEMLGRPAGVLCYRCLLLTPSGEIAGEGRAARDIAKNDYGDINKGVKMCEKGAQIDAILRTVALSDIFTQDFDTDEELDTKPVTMNAEPPRPARRMTEGERKELWQHLRMHGFPGATRDEAAARIKELTNLSLDETDPQTIIDALRTRQPAQAGAVGA
jgi:hypothetical protein